MLRSGLRSLLENAFRGGVLSDYNGRASMASQMSPKLAPLRPLRRSPTATALLVVLALALLTGVVGIVPAAADAISPPAIVSESVSGITEHDATLETQLNTEGLETTYKFYLQEAPLCLDANPPCEVPEHEPLVLPGEKLLGSFVGQSVSVDLNSAGVTLLPGVDYRYWVTATSAAGATKGQTQRFIAREGEVQPLTTAMSLGSQSTTGPSQNAGQSTITSETTDPVVGNVTPSAKMTALTNAQKLAKAVRVCKRKPRKQRAGCEKEARNKYGTTAKKTKKT